MEEQKKKSGLGARVKGLLKKKSVWAVLVIVVLVGFFASRGGEEAAEISTATVVRKDLQQTVSETGSVIAELELNYGWETSGRVAVIDRSVGDRVDRGSFIARLSNQKEQARLNEAYALYNGAKARLDLELIGPSDAEIRQAAAGIDQSEASLAQEKAKRDKTKVVADQRVESAEQALLTAENNLQLSGEEGNDNSELVLNAYEDLINELKSSTSKLSEALTQADNILGIDNKRANDDFEGVLGLLDKGALSRAELTYGSAKNKKERAEQSVQGLSNASTHAEIDAVALETKDAIRAMQTHLFDVKTVLDATNPIGVNLSQAELDALKDAIIASQTSVNTASTNVSNAEQAISTARNSLGSKQIAYDAAVLDLENAREESDADMRVANSLVDVAESRLDQEKASYDLLVNPPRDIDVASLRADVSRQSANIAYLQGALADTEVRALATGVIADISIDIGETVSLGQDIIKIISDQLNVEVDISETDITKVEIRDQVKITLDAFGDDVEFVGEVVSIEPAETEISGVIYYKTNILIEFADDQEVRPGMTANVDIMTDTAEQVLVIPRRAVIEEDGKKFVRVLKNKDSGEFDKKEVTTGLRGDNGEIEITSGLEEGEEIITFLKEE